MKRTLIAPLASIKPNAQKNVKRAPRSAGLRVFLFRIFFFSVLTTFGAAVADDSIPLPASPPTTDTASGNPPAESPDSPPVPMDTPTPAEAQSSESAPPKPDQKDDWTTDETLLPIVAEKFVAEVIKHSLSNRLYSLQFPDHPPPKPGEVLLLKTAAEPIMAFRVLRDMPPASTIIAQVIKKYGNHNELQPGEKYDAIIRSGEIANSSDIIEPTEVDYEDPTWVTSEKDEPILPYDPVLDFGTSPTPAEVAEKARSKPVSPLTILQEKVDKLTTALATLETKAAIKESEKEETTVSQVDSEKDKEPPSKEESKEDLEKDKEPPQSKEVSKDDATSKPSAEKLDEDLLQNDDAPYQGDTASIEEVKLMDNYAHWLSVGFGYVTNRAPNGRDAYNFSAGNIKYGITIGRRILFNRPNLQDSLALEGGAYVYKAINYVAAGDSYTLLTGQGTLRYNLFFSEGFAIFGYIGGMQHNVIGTASSVSSAITALSSVLPSVGGGFLLQIGPSWYARLTVGLDDTSLNLLLRF